MLKILRFFLNSNDLNLALISILYGWNIDEKKATSSTTPIPDWFKPKQNNTFAICHTWSKPHMKPL